MQISIFSPRKLAQADFTKEVIYVCANKVSYRFDRFIRNRGLRPI
jgi:hypothetical protein